MTTKMTKLLLTVTAVTLAPSVVAAQPAPSPSSPQHFFRSGPYVGASFGYSYQNASVRENVHFTLGPNSSGTSTARVHSNGVTGDIFLGYQYCAGNGFALGAEVTGALNSNEISKSIGTGPVAGTFSTTPSKSKGQIIPALVFGKQISQRLLAFLKAGPNINFFQFDHYITNSVLLGTKIGSYNKTSTGVMVGVGGEYAVSNQASILGTVSYLGTGNFRQNYPNFSDALDTPGATGSTNFKNNYYITAKASLKYTF